MKTFNRAACYVRVSTENQIENYSIEEQIERLQSYCLSKDWSIEKVYTDGGYSGGNVERPALMQMLDDIHAKKIDIVIVYKLDRLSRSQKDTLTLIEDEFLSNNVEFVSMSENFDTSTPFGRAMIGILSVFAQLEKDQITERFTMGRIGRGKAGYYHGGPTAPTGYKYIDGKLEIDEYRALQVQEVFSEFLTGLSINAIQRQMDEKYGGWSSHSLVSNVLRNTVYIGKVKFKKQTYEGIHAPIIAEDVFERVQELLHSEEREKKKTSAQKTPFKANNLLTSLVYCGRCEARYSGNHGYYKCYSRAKSSSKYIVDANCKNQNWEIEKLDSVIIREIIKMQWDSTYADRVYADRKKLPQIDIEVMKKRIKEVDMQISKLLDLYQVGSIPVDEISRRIQALRTEKEGLNEKAKTEGDSKKDAKAGLVIQLNEFDNVFKYGTPEEKRLFVSCIIESIVVDDENIIVRWRI